MDHKSLLDIIRSVIEEDLTRSVGHAAPGLGSKHKPRKNTYKATLGALENRKWGGNQARRTTSYNASRRMFEARNIAMDKLDKKKSKNKTETGQTPTSIELHPEKPEMIVNR